MPREDRVSKEFDIDTGAVKFTVTGGETFEFNVSQLSETIRNHALGHGLLQKIGDGYAGAAEKAAKAGQDVISWVNEYIGGAIERLLAGDDWSAQRGPGEGPAPTLVAEAVMRVKEAAGAAVDRAAILAKYSGKGSEAARKAVMEGTTPVALQVQAAVDAIRIERMQKRMAERAAKAAAATGDADAGSL